MENKIDLSIIENADVSINKLDKSLNETVKVLGDIKKTLKESAKKTSAEAKPASSGGGSSAKSSGGKSLQEAKLAVTKEAIKGSAELLKAIVEKVKAAQPKAAPAEVGKAGSSSGKLSATSFPFNPNFNPAYSPMLDPKSPLNPNYKIDITPFISSLLSFTPIKNPLTDLTSSSDATLDSAPELSRKGKRQAKRAQKKAEKAAGEGTEEGEGEGFTIADASYMTGVAGKQALGIIDELSKANEAAANEKREAAEKENTKEKDDLKKKFQQQLITKKEYDKGVEAADKELAKKKNDIALEQAKKERALSIAKVWIDSAVAIMAAWTHGPIVGGIMTGVITGLAIAQIAAIEKAPLPKARKGGLIAGRSHEGGGVLIEAEGGEAILSRAAMSAFPGVAELMNAAALNGGISDGGYAARSMVGGSVEFGGRGVGAASQGIDYERLSSMMSEKMGQAKIYVAVTDINDGQKNYARISDMAKL